jgi:hypothetical protein
MSTVSLHLGGLDMLILVHTEDCHCHPQKIKPNQIVCVSIAGGSNIIQDADTIPKDGGALNVSTRGLQNSFDSLSIR